jgi:outer membrane protein assembly factor BamB
MRLAVCCLPLVLIVWPFAAIAQDSGRLPESRQLDLTADWPWWRGPTRDGVAAAGHSPPLAWSESTNVVWKSPIPGRGHGSPIVVGEQVFVAAAEPDREVQSVLCFDRRTGDRQWQAEIHRGGFEKKGNAKSTLASGTCASDGERVFVNFLHAGAVYVTALSRDGGQLWQTKVSDFVMHQGYGASPAIYGELVIVASDNKGAGAVVALDRATGKVVWRHERPAKPNYASPILLRVADREQVLVTGCDLVASFEPATGRKLWEIEGATTECVTSPVTDGLRIFVSGGYPRNHVQAVRADGSGKIDWDIGARVYVPSMIAKDRHLYGVLDAGVAMCWKCDTGQEVWKGRLGGTFSSSLVLWGDHVLATNETGKTFVFKAQPSAFELVAENQLGSECFATPAVCGSRIYHRVAMQVAGKRQETLYCLGKSP